MRTWEIHGSMPAKNEHEEKWQHQRDKQIAAYNSGGFADADALAEKFIDLTNRIAAIDAAKEQK